MNKKNIKAALLTVIFSLGITTQSLASVLGSSKITGYSVNVGEGTYFTHNVFYSDQSGVGQQTENYLTYLPNSSVTPIITNGSYLYGKSTISSEVKRLLEDGVKLVGGINADFFSFQTGVPMSNLISDGKIVTKDASGQDSIGIMEDGTAFMSYVSFASVLIKEDGSETNIYNINKYRQPYAIYMMTSDFSDSTQNSTEGIDVVLGSIEGEMKLGTQLEAVVESVSENSGSIEIPKGKIVLTVDKTAPAEFLDPIVSLTEGERVKISFGVVGDERWKDVKLGMGCVGGRLLTDGEINPNLEKGAAPRTAIGITDKQELILYTIDGRQSGHSYGVQLKTLAERMKELGCTDALNLDGGGSTSIVSLLPGDSLTELKNSPSEGKERAVSTFVFLKNELEAAAELGTLTFYPLTAYMLKGAGMQFELKATDTAYYPMTLPEGISYGIASENSLSEIDQSGFFTANDSGTVRIKAEKDGVQALMDVVVLETPTDIKIKNADGTYPKSISVQPGEEVQLYAEAFGGYNMLTAENKCFSWSVSESLGTVTEDGLFTAREHTSASGELSVSAGGKSVSIPVTVSYTPDYSDKKNYPQLESTIEDGVLTCILKNEYNIPMHSDGIRLYADGNAVLFSFDETSQTITSSIPQETSRLTLYVTNEQGFTAFFTCSVKEYEGTGVFEDTKGHWAEDILGYMYENKIINGEKTDEGLIFRPQKQMNRAEFAVMICNYLKIDTESYSGEELPFADTSEIPQWALNSIKALYKNGILTGKTMPDGTVCAAPLSSVTRAEAAAITARTLADGFYPTQIGFSDSGDIPAWAEKGINTLITLGAIGGYPDGSLKPLNLLTKAEAAKILYSVM